MLLEIYLLFKVSKPQGHPCPSQISANLEDAAVGPNVTFGSLSMHCPQKLQGGQIQIYMGCNKRPTCQFTNGKGGGLLGSKQRKEKIQQSNDRSGVTVTGRCFWTKHSFLSWPRSDSLCSLLIPLRITIAPSLLVALCMLTSNSLGANVHTNVPCQLLQMS